MTLTRRGFLGGMFAAGAAANIPGCKTWCRCCGDSRPRPKIALQLYSIRGYIKKNGLEKALEKVAETGFKAVEFAGYWDFDAPAIAKMLADNGLAACGTHVSKDAFSSAKYRETCEFNLAIGNKTIICPGGGNFPPKDFKGPIDPFLDSLVEFYNTAAENCASYGCSVGLHNHMREFELKRSDGVTYWDWFFSHTDRRVLMQQDVGWTTCAGFDPAEQFAKYPHRSVSLHAKENGMGGDVKEFDAILGRPGRPGAKGVDWDAVLSAAERDGVEWLVVECEKHCDSFEAVAPSFEFLKAKGY